jgi:hypothetical protein
MHNGPQYQADKTLSCTNYASGHKQGTPEESA